MPMGHFISHPRLHAVECLFEIITGNLLTRKKQWRPPSKEKNRGNNLSARNRKACHSISIALLQSVALKYHCML
jgi:hypothetical protein